MTARPLLLAFALCFSAAGLLGAQNRVPTSDPMRVLIEYSEPTQLSRDFMVVRLHIVNRSGRDRSWVFEFNAPNVAYADGGRRSRFELEVSNREDREFELLVPLARSPDASWVQMIVFGYGVVNAGQVEVVANTVSSTAAVSLYAAMQQEHVRQALLGNHGPAEPISFDARSLTRDWRAYAGLSSLWLSTQEWTELDPDVRRTLTEWVAGGGRLVLVEPGEEVRPEPIRRHGMGAIVTVAAGLTGESTKTFLGVLPPEVPNRESIPWASSLVEPIETHRGVLSFFLVGYLMLAGPVNLFVLSPRGKRMRLFWTMPAIALGVSALMAVVIVLQDGVGGSGMRASFVYLQPEQNGLRRELVVQEQVSRTGALLRRSFDVDEPVHITPLATSYQARSYPDPASYFNDGLTYEGDWFRTRSVQAQRLQTTRPSRARIELVRGENGDVAVLSSIDARLDELYLRDEGGRVWRGENVLPGRPAALASATEAEYGRFRDEASYGIAGPAIQTLAAGIHQLPGTFLAIASEDANGATIDTLSSIDWTETLVLYGGHVDEGGR